MGYPAGDGTGGTGSVAVDDVHFTNDADSPHDFLTVAVPLSTGSFETRAPRRWKQARAELLPEFGFSSASTKWITRT